MHKRTAFSFTELIVVILACAIMATLLVPAVIAAGTVDKKKGCTSNLMAIGVGVEAYRTDHDERFMDAQLKGATGGAPVVWSTLLGCTQLGKYVRASRLNCPAMPAYMPERWSNPEQIAIKSNWMWMKPGYGYNAIWAGGVRRGVGGYDGGKPYSIAAVEEPENLLIIADSADSKRQFGGLFLHPVYSDAESVLWPRHDFAVNVLYADGHVAATASGMQECSNKSAAKLYAKGEELESSATANRVTCKWRADLD